MSYNGWSNYETWLVTMWYGDIFTDMANEGQLGAADYLQSYVEETVMEMGRIPDSGLVADILNAFLRQVDWEELYDHYRVEELEEEDA